jgi:peptidoglycan/LPS O-acetylase OafA/YrhL
MEHTMSSVAPNSVALAPTGRENESSTKLHYRRDLNGLRAIAVLAVVANHTQLLPGGGGVDIFFVLSGYLISANMFRQLERGNFSATEFYARRVRRLFPALIVMLLTMWLFGWLMFFPDEFQRLGVNLLAGAGFAQNIVLYGDILTPRGPLFAVINHIWSLGVEEQFYLLWPVFLLAVWHVRGSRLLVISAAAIVSFILNAWAVSHDLIGSYFLPWYRLWELALGGMLAYVQLNHTRVGEKLRTSFAAIQINWLSTYGAQLSGIAGAALLTAWFSGLTTFYEARNWLLLIPTLGAVLLISAGPDSWLNRYVLGSAPMVFVGLISYELYLWHWPLLTIVGSLELSPAAKPVVTVAAIAASFVLAYATGKLLEAALRHYQNRRRSAVALAGAMAACGMIGYLTMTQQILPRSISGSVQQIVRATEENWLPSGNRSFWSEGSENFHRIGSGRREVLFIGDSNVQQYFPPVTKLLEDESLNGYSAVFAARRWCDPTGLGVLPNTAKDCEQHLEKALAYARRAEVETVVIGACWYLYFIDFGSFTHFGAKGPLKVGADAAFERLRNMLTALAERGKKVYLVLPSPSGTMFDPHRMVQRDVVRLRFEVNLPAPDRATVVEAVSPVTQRLLSIAHDTGAETIDPMVFLCSSSTCPAVTQAGEPMYHDMWNLRPAYAREHVRYLDELFGPRPVTARVSVESAEIHRLAQQALPFLVRVEMIPAVQ